MSTKHNLCTATATTPRKTIKLFGCKGMGSQIQSGASVVKATVGSTFNFLGPTHILLHHETCDVVAKGIHLPNLVNPSKLNGGKMIGSVRDGYLLDLSVALQRFDKCEAQ